MNPRLNTFRPAPVAKAAAESTVADSITTSKLTPRQPDSLEQTGLSMGLLAELILKMIYFHGNVTGQKLEEIAKLPFLNVIDRVLEFLKLEEFVDIIGVEGGFSERAFQYTITARGRLKVHEVLDRSQYAGPAPVPLDEYVQMVRDQSVSEIVVDRPALKQAFQNIVISERMLDKIGPAANSARSLFLYGPPGNGKTTIAEGIANLMGGFVYVPYAIEIDGQILKVYDPLNHRPLQTFDVYSPEDYRLEAPPSIIPDARWVPCKRPQVVVGGELILSQLELIFDPITKVYEAPLQMKANGGLFLIDDFGRQQCRPQDLLNRWIVPLEKRVDYLALQTGKKIAIPFDVLIVFSTNLSPRDLVDDAFLRRIRHKIEITNPSPNEFREIFKRVAAAKQIPYSDDGLRYLIQEHYMKTGRDLRSCHPRDLCDQILDEAKYRGIPPDMSRDLIDRACEAYFVKLA